MKTVLQSIVAEKKRAGN